MGFHHLLFGRGLRVPVLRVGRRTLLRLRRRRPFRAARRAPLCFLAELASDAWGSIIWVCMSLHRRDVSSDRSEAVRVCITCLASLGAEGNSIFPWRRPRGEAIGDDGRPRASRDNSISPCSA